MDDRKNAKASSRAMRLLYISKPASLHAEPYTLKEDPQPQVLFTFGFSNLKPAPSRVST
jgi:hypothetical protein